MKAKVIKPQKKEHVVRTASIKKVAEDSFEQDWANSISSDEFWKRVHQHIEKLYATPPKK